MSDIFKKCPKGHIFNTDLGECPFCGGLEIDDALINLPKPPNGSKLPDDIADCYYMPPDDIKGDDDEW